MRQADNALRQAAQKAEMVLLYYAGYGLQIDGLNYLVPINLPMPDQQGLKTQAGLDALASQLASFDELIKGLDEHTQLAIIIADCPRSASRDETGPTPAYLSRRLKEYKQQSKIDHVSEQLPKESSVLDD